MTGPRDGPGRGEHGHHGEGPERGRTLRHYVEDFFTNWREYEGSLAKKAWLTVRNRTVAYTPPIRGCCGRRGEPGC